MPVIGNDVGLAVERIVLATDLSPASEQATQYAEALAKRYESKLTLAHVLDLSAITRSEDAAAGFALEQARRSSNLEMTELLERVVQDGVKATGHSLEARNPAAAIVKLAAEIDAALIVAGTHARHGLTKAILGSCAEGIIRHATCPVVTVGPKVKPLQDRILPLARIVFATDFRSNVEAKISIALAFAQDAGAQISLLHVMEHPAGDISESLEMRLKVEALLEKMIPKSAYDWCDPECVIEEGNASEHIRDLAKRKRADLIILGARQSSSWLTHLNDGVVGSLLREAECPVMTIGSK